MQFTFFSRFNVDRLLRGWIIFFVKTNTFSWPPRHSCLASKPHYIFAMTAEQPQLQPLSSTTHSILKVCSFWGLPIRQMKSILETSIHIKLFKYAIWQQQQGLTSKFKQTVKRVHFFDLTFIFRREEDPSPGHGWISWNTFLAWFFACQKLPKGFLLSCWWWRFRRLHVGWRVDWSGCCSCSSSWWRCHWCWWNMMLLLLVLSCWTSLLLSRLQFQGVYLFRGQDDYIFFTFCTFVTSARWTITN